LGKKDKLLVTVSVDSQYLGLRDFVLPVFKSDDEDSIRAKLLSYANQSMFEINPLVSREKDLEEQRKEIISLFVKN